MRSMSGEAAVKGTRAVSDAEEAPTGGRREL
jgi:hypothetical protein